MSNFFQVIFDDTERSYFTLPFFHTHGTLFLQNKMERERPGFLQSHLTRVCAILATEREKNGLTLDRLLWMFENLKHKNV